MASPTSNPPPPRPSPPQDPDQNPNDHQQNHSSPSLTPPTPPSPPPPNPNSTIPASPAKKPHPLPWSHQETVNLIEAYQEKWYSLKRGPLKSSQWEEVAVTVAARCGYEEPTKTAVQCRHKIEKLRKRYRAEKTRPNPHAWDFFALMHQLDHGPLPISAQPMSMIQFQKPIPKHDHDDDSDQRNKSKSINRILRGHVSNKINKPPSPTNQKLSGFGFGGGGVGDKGLGFLGKRSARKRPERFERYKSESESESEEEEKEEAEAEGGGVVAELAGQIKGFAERLVRMEKKKMEMMRETERYRMEMENKRMEMIRESQRKILDTIGRAFGSSHKKMKTTGQDI